MKSISFNNIKMPYYEFNFIGDYYKSLRRLRKEPTKTIYLDNGERIDEHFLANAVRQIKDYKNQQRYEKSTLIIVHNFDSYDRKDFDNAYYKPIIDAIKKVRIIYDDSWLDISLMFLGSYSPEEKITVFVVEHFYTIPFLNAKFNDYFNKHKPRNTGIEDRIRTLKNYDNTDDFF
ncbi:hypothetical protein [Cytobacillus horneckiae]|uniref:Uncharacterized protein n=1 Tax=Cytobacillus horneckiae TaxID=549687 RepID=A0A2N0ZB17_9BACI|nr:hypothetical protein [Cytobacillus horneckiae]MEC1158694.1 hypothetical protein [Cytobacillus horneckiae]PKG26694.1 hypothetical protein CWS20_22875 [Cytobacillus horneckiae]